MPLEIYPSVWVYLYICSFTSYTQKKKAFGIKSFEGFYPRISDYVYYTDNALSESDYIFLSKISLKHDELTYMNWNNEHEQFAQ